MIFFELNRAGEAEILLRPPGRSLLVTLATEDYCKWRSANGETVLHAAARHWSTTPLRHCLWYGCDQLLNVQTTRGYYTALHIAGSNFSCEMASMLLEAGADPNIQDCFGRLAGQPLLSDRHRPGEFEMAMSCGMSLEAVTRQQILTDNPHASALCLMDWTKDLPGFWEYRQRTTGMDKPTEDERHEVRWRVHFRQSLVERLLLGLTQGGFFWRRAPVKRLDFID